jgi:hypothetical protein
VAGLDRINVRVVAMQTFVRVGNAVMGLVFLLAAAVQYNDPDPVPWMLVYGAAMFACVLALLRREHRHVAGLTGAVALVWALILLPRVAGQVAPGEMFREAGMATLEIEEAREALGLLIVVLWMVVLYVVRRSPQR